MSKGAFRLIAGGVLVLIAGVGFSIAMAVMMILAPSQYPKMVVPGEATIEFEEIGNYTIFHEVVSEVDGVQYESEANLRKELDVELTHEASGEAIAVRPIQSFAFYTYGDGLYAESAFRFRIDEPGAYQMTVTHAFDIDTVNAVFNVVHEATIQRKIGGIALGLVLACFIGMTLVVSGVIVYARSGRQIAPSSAPNPSGQVFPPPPPQ